jgi:hypothetical protein
MEACEIKVTLGCTVWALRVYALLCIKLRRFGMGAMEMASGRRPSMDRISTRRARAVGVGVKAGVDVSVAVPVVVTVAGTVDVRVIVGLNVGSGVAVAGPGRLGPWHPTSMSIEKTSKNFLIGMP